MNYKKNLGFTLIELLVTVLIASVLVAAILVLLKSYRQMSSQIKSDIDTEFYVAEFIDSFSEEIASSGYQPIGSNLTSIYNSGKIINFTLDNNSNVNSVSIITDLDTSTRQTITYSIKAINPVRSNSYTNELGIYKTKVLFNQSSYTPIAVFRDALALAGVKSFQCYESLNTASPVNNNAMTRGVSCSLVMNVYLNLVTPLTKTYNFYAKAENQF